MVGEDGPSRPPRARSSAIMAGPDLDTLSGLMDEAKCFALVRQHRWPDGVRCPACGSGAVDRKSTRLNSSHANISYAVFCLKKKKTNKLSTNHREHRYFLSVHKNNYS